VTIPYSPRDCRTHVTSDLHLSKTARSRNSIDLIRFGGDRFVAICARVRAVRNIPQVCYREETECRGCVCKMMCGRAKRAADRSGVVTVSDMYVSICAVSLTSCGAAVASPVARTTKSRVMQTSRLVAARSSTAHAGFDAECAVPEPAARCSRGEGHHPPSGERVRRTGVREGTSQRGGGATFTGWVRYSRRGEENPFHR